MISISFLSHLLYFLACLLLAVNANAAKSSTSKGNKPSAAIDETAEMLCNVLVQASKELIHDSSVKVNLLKEYLRQDCSKLPKALNLVQKVNLRKIILSFFTVIVTLSSILVSSRCWYLRSWHRRSYSNGNGKHINPWLFFDPSNQSMCFTFAIGIGQNLSVDSRTWNTQFDSFSTKIIQYHTKSNLCALWIRSSSPSNIRYS